MCTAIHPVLKAKPLSVSLSVAKACSQCSKFRIARRFSSCGIQNQTMLAFQ